ncbi:hypothetical protein B0T14DRAFT_572164 [Immersiella caudata]|uniref:Uncharacterized protein n=1 Tax=Immersiella caudata TaxID=314043 RepID=A0AA39TG58_9PEZI|nr:hypothetical protein B0T14DRAFT_572164 [Immersiella caudata]
MPSLLLATLLAGVPLVTGAPERPQRLTTVTKVDQWHIEAARDVNGYASLSESLFENYPETQIISACACISIPMCYRKATKTLDGVTETMSTATSTVYAMSTTTETAFSTTADVSTASSLPGDLDDPTRRVRNPLPPQDPERWRPSWQGSDLNLEAWNESYNNTANEQYRRDRVYFKSGAHIVPCIEFHMNHTQTGKRQLIKSFHHDPGPPSVTSINQNHAKMRLIDENGSVMGTLTLNSNVKDITGKTISLIIHSRGIISVERSVREMPE